MARRCFRVWFRKILDPTYYITQALEAEYAAAEEDDNDETKWTPSKRRRKQIIQDAKTNLAITNVEQSKFWL